MNLERAYDRRKEGVTDKKILEPGAWRSDAAGLSSSTRFLLVLGFKPRSPRLGAAAHFLKATKKEHMAVTVPS
ncbi:hypothetical protein Mapa_007521 [Marchantia paleacea]|nr:hypothetical protein Mapa_007521 [Marchantia paleacea]